MNTPAPDFVTVDMRGLKAALVARAQAERVSVSVLVRSAVARDLGLSASRDARRLAATSAPATSAASVKLSIRLTPQTYTTTWDTNQSDKMTEPERCAAKCLMRLRNP